MRFIKVIKKSEQIAINEKVESVFKLSNDEVIYTDFDAMHRLRTMSAQVFETNNYYHLVSYNTRIAVIDKHTDECYDFLRLVYGYTSTSAKHVAAFKADYSNKKWASEVVMYTWREV